MYICGLFLKLFFYQLCSFYWPKYTLPSVQADSIAGPRVPHTTHYIKYIIICIAIFFICCERYRWFHCSALVGVN